MIQLRLILAACGIAAGLSYLPGNAAAQGERNAIGDGAQTLRQVERDLADPGCKTARD